MIKPIKDLFGKYSFLLQQLVARDFKVKYKRSVLGVAWSLLNPLLTMFVQYFVFSNLFRYEIENYVVYLLIGIICFNYFSEAANQSLYSILSNASLITKVYLPKYIFPFAKILSVGINFLLSLIPLIIVSLITGLSITPYWLLLIFDTMCLVLFLTGIGLILSSLMVFFRDMQFIWGLVNMMWMYMTPIFYPAEIIPARFRFVQTFNPLFHFINFMRIVVIEGVNPGPTTYLACLISALGVLLIGCLVFNKTQDKFTLYL